MKKYLQIGRKLMVAVLCTTLCSLSSYAQKPGSEAAMKAEYEQKVAEELAKYELKGIRTSLPLLT